MADFRSKFAILPWSRRCLLGFRWRASPWNPNAPQAAMFLSGLIVAKGAF